MDNKYLESLPVDTLRDLWDEADKPNNTDRADGEAKGAIAEVLGKKLKQEPGDNIQPESH